MPKPEQALRQDALGRLLRQAYSEQRGAEPPASVLRAVRLEIRPAAQTVAPAWRDRLTALSWPHGSYAADLLPRSALTIHYGLAF